MRRSDNNCAAVCRCDKVRMRSSWLSEGSRERGAPALSSSRLTALSQPHTEILFVPSHGTKCSTPWNKTFHPMEQSVPPHGTNRKAAPSWSESAAFEGEGVVYFLSLILFHPAWMLGEQVTVGVCILRLMTTDFCLTCSVTYWQSSPRVTLPFVLWSFFSK